MPILSPWDPARESERLRSILETLAQVQPNMPVSEAIAQVFAIEKDAAERERVESLNRPDASSATRTPSLSLPDTSPETISALIDLCPTAQSSISSGNFVKAAQELRSFATSPGGVIIPLKDLLKGITHWASKHGITIPSSPATPASSTHIFDWIIGTSDEAQDVRDSLYIYTKETSRTHAGRMARIDAVRSIREHCPGGPSLTEVLKGIDMYLRRCK